MAFSTNDRRQIILDRLYELLGGLTIPLLGGPDGAVSIIPGNIVQNRNELPKDKVPGIVILDADEIKDPRAQLRERGLTETRVPSGIMKMTPEIYVVLDTRGITNKNFMGDRGGFAMGFHRDKQANKINKNKYNRQKNK